MLCRAGFEGELAAEWSTRARGLGLTGFCRARQGEARVEWSPAPGGQEDAAERLVGLLPPAELVFARQVLWAGPVLSGLSPEDRVRPLAEAFLGMERPLAGLILETPDQPELRPLAALCRGLARPLEAALGKTPLWRPGRALHRAHVVLLGSRVAEPALGLVDSASPWPGGIPRLKLPADIPSRSARKLEEALLTFLEPEERAARLAPGMRAVDLGAAPGGWSQLMARRGLAVIAVDNGPLDGRALASGLIEHRREDGFRYAPPGPVDWMVCDMVEAPGRVARLVARWLAEGRCRECIFNLKLPMKKRWQELTRCRELIETELGRAGVGFGLRFKQLYHDREEVTGHLRRLGP
jgi:23S rRNA (cytidine2498-2'-O)-methyltransferase